MEIIPAILENDYNKVAGRLSQIAGLVDIVQLDVCDGKLTPSATWPYRKHDENFEKIAHEETSLPFWDELDFEIDLMVADPADVLDSWIAAGASSLIFHYESFDHSLNANDPKSLPYFISEYRKRFPRNQENVSQSFDPQLALAIGSQIEPGVIDEFIPQIDGVQFMGIDKIGFQGQQFNSKVLDRIKTFKQNHPGVVVSVDGGVSMENLEALKNSGVDRVVVGSAIFTSDNVNQTVAELIQAAKL